MIRADDRRHDWCILTGRVDLHVIATELGGHGKLLPHDPVFSFAIQSDCRRMMYNLQTHSSVNTLQPLHPMGCDAQLAWKCLFAPTFSRFWPVK